MKEFFDRLTSQQLEAILDGQGFDECPGVDTQFDIELRPATPTQPRQYGTLYQPLQPTHTQRAGMLAFHGGGFISGDPTDAAQWPKYWPFV